MYKEGAFTIEKALEKLKLLKYLKLVIGVNNSIGPEGSTAIARGISKI